MLFALWKPHKSRLYWPLLRDFCSHHRARAKAFFAFTLLIATYARTGGLVNDGATVHFIVDKGDWLCYFHLKIMLILLPLLCLKELIQYKQLLFLCHIPMEQYTSNLHVQVQCQPNPLSIKPRTRAKYILG